MPYSPSLISYAFVKKGIENDLPVTQMKLQKMVYFAHGYHLAKYGSPLVDQAFEAWKFGPVIPSIYQYFKFYGDSKITDTYFLDVFDQTPDLSELDFKALEAIAYTWEATKKLTALQLSAWSHKTGSPWANAYNPDIQSIPIPNEEIKKYFSDQLAA